MTAGLYSKVCGSVANFLRDIIMHLGKLARGMKVVYC